MQTFSGFGKNTSILIFETGNPPSDYSLREWLVSMAIPYRELVGKYKGEVNRSFAVPFSRYMDVFPWFHLEESVLVLQPYENTYRAQLFFPETKFFQPIGEWKEIKASDVKRYDGATFDPISDRWFTTTGTKRVHRNYTRHPSTIVGLHTQDGRLTVWPIYRFASDNDDAVLKEAWADFRRVIWDGQEPPEWTHAHFLGRD